MQPRKESVRDTRPRIQIKQCRMQKFRQRRTPQVQENRRREPGKQDEQSTHHLRESSVAKRERAHAEMEVRPGEEEEDEPAVEEEAIGKKRRILRLGEKEILLERGAERVASNERRRVRG